MSKWFSSYIRGHKKQTVAVVLLAVVLVVAFIGFKVLVKVGSPKYFYNYLHDARGSLPVRYDEAAASGADAGTPYATLLTSPKAHGVIESIRVNNKETENYERQYNLGINVFGKAVTDSTPGMVTFRGSFTRNLSPESCSLEKVAFSNDLWEYSTGKILKSNGVDYWSGNGWTGQPLLAEWNDVQKSTMNLYDTAKEKEGLVEIIYPGMDGSIHFLDLETGEETRPAIYVGMTFKGTASLYPGGVPLLVCGCGDAQTGMFGENVSQRFYIYSLVDGSLLYEGGYNDPFAPRIWHAYDSSPVIDPISDTLIQPGENGVIYTLKLNTEYDSAAGTLSISPSEFVDYSFTIEDKYKEGGYLWGSECSAAVFENYLFIGDNAGTIYCLDLNTMKMVWVNEVNEDINSSPIFEEDGRNKYLYVATTLKYNYDAHSMGEACIFKLNAMTGEIIWTKPYEVHTVKGYAGGVLSTGIIGEGKLKDYLFYSVSKTPGVEDGYLVALDKYSGEEIWTLALPMYSWSSTAILKSRDNYYLVQGCQNGDLLLIDAEEGKILDSRNFGSGIEATPVIYNNRVVFATRSEKILSIGLE